MDATVDSIVHGFYSINVLHVAHEEKKYHNLWPITEAIPKPINTQKWGTYANFLNSSNDIFASHDGKTISIEDDPSEADLNKDSPKTPNNHNGNHSLFQYILPCNYNRKYYTCLDAGHDNLLNRQFKSECGVDHSSFSSSENITEVNGSTLKKPKSTFFFVLHVLLLLKALFKEINMILKMKPN